MAFVTVQLHAVVIGGIGDCAPISIGIISEVQP